MKNKLERFKIIGLHGHKTIEIKILDNTLILVGENGSGKTTFLRILFNFISGKWDLLLEFSFISILAEIDGTQYELHRHELFKSLKTPDRPWELGLPESTIKKLYKFNELAHKTDSDEETGERFNIAQSMVLYEDFIRNSGIKIKISKELQDKINKIQKALDANILYLPTYRRIERELSSIFENLSDENFQQKRHRYRKINADNPYFELVEFGMKDVQDAVNSKLAQIKEFARESLNNLTLKYLGAVVNREYQTVTMQELQDFSQDTAQEVLDRIDDSILTKRHKDHLLNVLNKARQAGTADEHQKILFHYFLKLLEFQQSLKIEESAIAEFCELCSEYIIDKRFIYDSSTFKFSIAAKETRQNSKPITLSDLSSGEKQIVSLFSHIYLYGKQNFFVLIDEPELSLSVPWQKRFLIDIRNGRHCMGLVAVTHSPFIYDNALRPYTHALGEFVKS